nr:CPBP family intramembrane glutamic endopeptidase [uncultured Actinotalea sp.]
MTTTTTTPSTAPPSTRREVGWLLQPDEPARRPPRVPPGVEYHRVYAGPKRRILRGVLAIVLLLAGMIVFGQLFLNAAETIDAQVFDRAGFTPLRQAAGSLSLVLLIPWSMLLQRVLYGVPAASLHSVTGRFRHGLLGRALLVLAPLLLVAVAIPFLEPADTVPWTTADLVALFLASAVLTPLAAAGEEYGFRGLMFRVVGSWTRGARSGLVLGTVVTTVVFSLLHGTLDPYLLTTYLVLFGSMAIVTWRTGGLEVAVVLHAVYNTALFVLALMLQQDVGGALEGRGEATGSPVFLVPSAVLVVITALVWWMTRRTGAVRTPSA